MTRYVYCFSVSSEGCESASKQFFTYMAKVSIKFLLEKPLTMTITKKSIIFHHTYRVIVL